MSSEIEKLRKENEELKAQLEKLQPTSTSDDRSLGKEGSPSIQVVKTADTYPTFRYNGPPQSNLTPLQTQIKTSILKTRKGTGLSGPFGPWLANPSLCNHAQLLGKFCRYDTSLGMEDSELIIMLVACYMECKGEWVIHYPMAVEAGVDVRLLEYIDGNVRLEGWKENGLKPATMLSEFVKKLVEEKDADNSSDGNAKQQKNKFTCSLIRYVCGLLENNGRISDELYLDTLEVLGGGEETKLVEVVGIVGYYVFVAYTLNCFGVRPAGC